MYWHDDKLFSQWTDAVLKGFVGTCNMVSNALAPYSLRDSALEPRSLLLSSSHGREVVRRHMNGKCTQNVSNMTGKHRLSKLRSHAEGFPARSVRWGFVVLWVTGEAQTKAAQREREPCIVVWHWWRGRGDANTKWSSLWNLIPESVLNCGRNRLMTNDLSSGFSFAVSLSLENFKRFFKFELLYRCQRGNLVHISDGVAVWQVAPWYASKDGLSVVTYSMWCTVGFSAALTYRLCTRSVVLTRGRWRFSFQSCLSTEQCHLKSQWPTEQEGWLGWCSVEAKHPPGRDTTWCETSFAPLTTFILRHVGQVSSLLFLINYLTHIYWFMLLL